MVRLPTGSSEMFYFVPLSTVQRVQKLAWFVFSADMAVCTCAYRNSDVRGSLTAAELLQQQGKSAPLLRGYSGFSGDLAHDAGPWTLSLLTAGC